MPQVWQTKICNCISEQKCLSETTLADPIHRSSWDLQVLSVQLLSRFPPKHILLLSIWIWGCTNLTASIFLQLIQLYFGAFHFHISTLQKGDWMFKLDLKDAYFAVPISQDHRLYLQNTLEEDNVSFQPSSLGPIFSPKSVHKDYSLSVDKSIL